MYNGGGSLCHQAAGERVVGRTVPSKDRQDPHDLSAGGVEGGADGQPQRHAEPCCHATQNTLWHRRDSGTNINTNIHLH